MERRSVNSSPKRNRSKKKQGKKSSVTRAAVTAVCAPYRARVPVRARPWHVSVGSEEPVS
jgi:hypothetical protein